MSENEQKMEFQTRRHNGELRFFDTLAAALRDADDSPYGEGDAREVWKISFSLPNGERVRLVRQSSMVGGGFILA